MRSRNRLILALLALAAVVGIAAHQMLLSGKQETKAPAMPKEESIKALFGETLINAKGENVDIAALDGKKIALYFSAQWCPPCRTFTPELVKTYNAIKAEGKPFELVFVSSDRSREDMLTYMKEYNMTWLALPYDAPARTALGRRYGIRGIPALVVINAAGETLTSNGRNDVMSYGASAYDQW